MHNNNNNNNINHININIIITLILIFIFITTNTNTNTNRTILLGVIAPLARFYLRHGWQVLTHYSLHNVPFQTHALL